jgi:hypothetical protein
LRKKLNNRVQACRGAENTKEKIQAVLYEIRELLILVVVRDPKENRKIRIKELVVFMKEPLKRSSPFGQARDSVPTARMVICEMLECYYKH